jgi:hypothetical protein
MGKIKSCVAKIVNLVSVEKWIFVKKILIASGDAADSAKRPAGIARL